MGKVAQLASLVIVAILMRRWARWLLMLVSILYLAAAAYNIWGR